ncbi:uncharacterized protein EKO05_0008183 [Ascochyta rabiei]|uniref:uncharacterized protein n=1 Tax=Didymella rabiei TaxID=5454 RepID=UPI00220D4F54|nr:uncharacterized protein EKO05_0008183 [Ascochyta rabiei]UPX17856.1 hypothetical protein EKO05_0008183 [Ascochyta rabiei]
MSASTLLASYAQLHASWHAATLATHRARNGDRQQCAKVMSISDAPRPSILVVQTQPPCPPPPWRGSARVAVTRLPVYTVDCREGQRSARTTSSTLFPLGPSEHIPLFLALLCAQLHKILPTVTQRLCKAEQRQLAMYLIQPYSCMSANALSQTSLPSSSFFYAPCRLTRLSTYIDMGSACLSPSADIFVCASHHNKRVSQAALQLASLRNHADHVTTSQVQRRGLPCDPGAKPYSRDELS